MKRLILILPVVLLMGVTGLALAGDFHVGLTLVCTDCHVAHGSQAHSYSNGSGAGTVFPAMGAGAPYNDLLRDDEVKLCLQCHNGQSGVPDVFGASATNPNRLAGGLNVLNANTHGLVNESGYDENFGHTLYSKATPPGYAGTYTPSDEGLTCTNCHAQHGIATTYRNLLNRGIFDKDSLTYNYITAGTNDPSKWVFERSWGAYTTADVDFNEPSQTSSRYAEWCQNCHQNFHGASGSTEMGGQSGGVTAANTSPWKRHPASDVNIGTPSATFISSLAQFKRTTNPDKRVKVMSAEGKWRDADPGSDLTPTCFSCHKGHGSKNPFGLVYLSNASTSTGAVTENGNGGNYVALCRQCHVQGADAPTAPTVSGVAFQH